MRGEIDRVEQLFRRCGDDPHLDHVAYAFEDLPEDARGQARMLMKVPADGSLAEKVIEVSTNPDHSRGSLAAAECRQDRGGSGDFSVRV